MTRHAWDFVPTHDEERPRGPITRPLFWVLSLLHAVFRVLANVTYRARRYVGYTMYDRPCPRCGASLWRDDGTGCACLLTTPVHCTVQLPPDSWLDGQTHLRVKLHTRTELFHWGRIHDLFADSAAESIARDDRLVKLGHEPPKPRDRAPRANTPRRGSGGPFSMN